MNIIEMKNNNLSYYYLCVLLLLISCSEKGIIKDNKLNNISNKRHVDKNNRYKYWLRNIKNIGQKKVPNIIYGEVLVDNPPIYDGPYPLNIRKNISKMFNLKKKDRIQLFGRSVDMYMIKTNRKYGFISMDYVLADYNILIKESENAEQKTNILEYSIDEFDYIKAAWLESLEKDVQGNLIGSIGVRYKNFDSSTSSWNCITFASIGEHQLIIKLLISKTKDRKANKLKSKVTFLEAEFNCNYENVIGFCLGEGTLQGWAGGDYKLISTNNFLNNEKNQFGAWKYQFPDENINGYYEFSFVFQSKDSDQIQYIIIKDIQMNNKKINYAIQPNKN